MSKQSTKLSVTQFYPYYLGEHQNVICRRLHMAGSVWGLYCLQKAIRTKKMRYLPMGLLGGYGCAWVGHFFFEKNKPATFDYPLQSFVGDWMMFKDILAGKLSVQDVAQDKLGYKDLKELQTK